MFLESILYGFIKYIETAIVKTIASNANNIKLICLSMTLINCIKADIAIDSSSKKQPIQIKV